MKGNPLDVVCPTCKAGVGERCSMPRGRAIPSQGHRTRRTLAATGMVVSPRAGATRPDGWPRPRTKEYRRSVWTIAGPGLRIRIDESKKPNVKEAIRWLEAQLV